MKSCLDHPTGKVESVGIHSQGQRTHITYFCDNGSKLLKGGLATLGRGYLFPALAAGLHDLPRTVVVSCFPRLVLAGLHVFPPLAAVVCLLGSSWMSLHALQRLHVFPRTVAV